MWLLIVMVCTGLQCTDQELISTHKTKAECIEALDAKFEEFKSGQAGMCIEGEDIKT